MSFTESTVENAALDWFKELGYEIGHGPEIAPGEPAAERDSLSDAVLSKRLRTALRKLNPTLPAEALDEAFRKITIPHGASLITDNRTFHRLLVDGI